MLTHCETKKRKREKKIYHISVYDVVSGVCESGGLRLCEWIKHRNIQDVCCCG